MPTPREAIDALLPLDAELSEDERRWRDAAASVVREHVAPHIADDFEAQRLRSEVIPELARAGLFGMHLDGYGCAGAGPIAYGLACLELEAVDSAWRTLVSVQGSLAMTAIHRFGSENQRETLLPAMASGEKIGCFALTEPTGGSDPAAMTTFARRDGDDWVLSGRKRWIGLASIADIAIVWAQTDAGVHGFIVDTSSPGFRATPIAGKLSMRASVQCDVVLDDVRVPEASRLPGASSLRAPFTCLNEARYGISWGVMGAARSCLEAAIGRATTRDVFGGPIGAKQLVQRKLADMAVAYSTGVLLALQLGRWKQAGVLTPEQLSLGKLNNVRQAQEIARTARSILGGDGITSEFAVMRHMANLESVATYEGTDEVHTLVLGRALTGLSAF